MSYPYTAPASRALDQVRGSLCKACVHDGVSLPTLFVSVFELYPDISNNRLDKKFPKTIMTVSMV